jgi:malic enzyme
MSLETKLADATPTNTSQSTAIIIAAGLLNALEIQGKTPENAMLTCLGAGAAGIATLDLLCELGFQKSNILLVDSKGVRNVQFCN